MAMATQQNDSRLLALSAELRNEIYGHVFLIKNGQRTTELRLHPHRRRMNNSSSTNKYESVDLALLATCRLIHDEAVGLCYAINIIGVDCNKILQLASKLGTPRLSNIKSLRVHVEKPDNMILVCRVVRKFMPAVKTLDVVFDHGYNPAYYFAWEQFRASQIYTAFLRADTEVIENEIAQLKSVETLKFSFADLPYTLSSEHSSGAGYRLMMQMQRSDDEKAVPKIEVVRVILNSLLPSNKAKEMKALLTKDGGDEQKMNKD